MSPATATVLCQTRAAIKLALKIIPDSSELLLFRVDSSVPASARRAGIQGDG